MNNLLLPDASWTNYSSENAQLSPPDNFPDPFRQPPHQLALLAAADLQIYLGQPQDWTHNFGLTGTTVALPIIGKMFGVLVVADQAGALGYLAAFSGKLAGSNHHAGFVPPLFDGVAAGGFLNEGMLRLGQINEQIAALKATHASQDLQITQLQSVRKQHSYALQQQIFEQYHFLNSAGKRKSLVDLFFEANGSKPPAGAGECAAPKLLQYAFQHQWQPVALAEFWWGQSPKSTYWQHKNFYPACREKCAPILAHMLQGLVP